MLNAIINVLTAINAALHPVRYRQVVIYHSDYMEVRNVRIL